MLYDVTIRVITRPNLLDFQTITVDAKSGNAAALLGADQFRSNHPDTEYTVVGVTPAKTQATFEEQLEDAYKPKRGPGRPRKDAAAG